MNIISNNYINEEQLMKDAKELSYAEAKEVTELLMGRLIIMQSKRDMTYEDTVKFANASVVLGALGKLVDDKHWDKKAEE